MAGRLATAGVGRPLRCGAVIAALARSDELVLSPEAAAARALFLGTGSVLDAVRGCASGVELIAGGFGQDVELAAQCDVSQIVPVLVDRAFRPATATAQVT